MDARAGAEASHPRVVFVTFDCVESNFLCAPFKEALRRTGVSGRIVSPDTREDPVATLSLFARQGYDLVIVSATWAETLAEVAPRFPKTRFAIIDTPLADVRGRPGNVQSVLIRTNEAAYLAGWLAARLEQRRPGKDVVGVVGGMHVQPVEDFIVGFPPARGTPRRRSPFSLATRTTSPTPTSARR